MLWSYVEGFFVVQRVVVRTRFLAGIKAFALQPWDWQAKQESEIYLEEVCYLAFGKYPTALIDPIDQELVQIKLKKNESLTR